MSLLNNTNPQSLIEVIKFFDDIINRYEYSNIDDLISDNFVPDLALPKFSSGDQPIDKAVLWWFEKNFWIIDGGKVVPNNEYGNGSFRKRMMNYLLTKADERKFFSDRHEGSVIRVLTSVMRIQGHTYLSAVEASRDKIQLELNNTGLPLDANSEQIPEPYRAERPLKLGVNDSEIASAIRWGNLLGVMTPFSDGYLVDPLPLFNDYCQDIYEALGSPSRPIPARAFVDKVADILPIFQGGKYANLLFEVSRSREYSASNQLDESFSATIRRAQGAGLIRLTATRADDANALYLYQDTFGNPYPISYVEFLNV